MPENKKKRAVEEEEQGEKLRKGVETVTIIVETKTVRDDNGNPTTIVTTTKSKTYAPPSPHTHTSAHNSSTAGTKTPNKAEARERDVQDSEYLQLYSWYNQ